jgi:predicted GIY-YIG superfamily endonuclease
MGHSVDHACFYTRQSIQQQMAWTTLHNTSLLKREMALKKLDKQKKETVKALLSSLNMRSLLTYNFTWLGFNPH